MESTCGAFDLIELTGLPAYCAICYSVERIRFRVLVIGYWITQPEKVGPPFGRFRNLGESWPMQRALDSQDSLRALTCKN
jgi:hypothetical protein